MRTFERLVSVGIPEELAFETAWWFSHYGNESDLERFICELTNGQRERVNDG